MSYDGPRRPSYDLQYGCRYAIAIIDPLFRCREPGPVPFSTLLDAFQYQVDNRPDSVALIAQRTSSGILESFTWASLAALTNVTLSHLSREFDRDPAVCRHLCHASDQTLSDVLIALASMHLGATEVSIDGRLSDQEIQRRQDHVGGIRIDGESRSRVQNGRKTIVDPTRSRLDPDAPSLILFTSGTTSTPRGVVLSQRSLAGNAHAKLLAVPQYPDDVRLTVLSLSHAYARTCDFGTWLLSGSTLALTLGFEGLVRLAPLVRPTLINVVPSIAYRLLDEDLAKMGLDRLRLLGCGGAPISVDAFDKWTKRGVTVIQGYGLTEAGPVICSATPGQVEPGLVGDFVNGWEHEIRDGELFVRGSHTMLGYWNDLPATKQKVDRQGWLRTGDLVERDTASRQIRVLGRVDDVIVLENGNKISPSVIERDLEQLPNVRHAMLLLREKLELWIDSHETANERLIRDVLSRHMWSGEVAIHRFSAPLSQATGELTVKGTLRRSQIMVNRFS